jgi:ubiquinone/menaquinone biosynthesis C-methylase UbiE
MPTHELRVENFYSTGRLISTNDFDTLDQKTLEFLSFGYWHKDTKTYHDAADNLLNFVIAESGIKNAKTILNVACGYGAETFRYFKSFNPEKIVGLDITQKHVDYANDKARQLNQSEQIQFQHGNACDLQFPEQSFTQILGIEGPAHFKTREEFFKSAQKVLTKDGEIVLTDIILGAKYQPKKWSHRLLMKFICKKWVVPIENQVGEEGYNDQLRNAGLTPVFLQKIGDKVFPGYGRNAFSLKTFKMRLGLRGFIPTLGLTIISWMLGYLYKKGIIEYIYVKAKK